MGRGGRRRIGKGKGRKRTYIGYCWKSQREGDY
jgi:hypothetical protein